MINECNSDLTHKEIIDEVVRYLKVKHDHVYPEFRMPERRRADVLLLTKSNQVLIFECKQDYRPRDIAHSVLKYALWCNQLFIVMNAGNARLHFDAVNNNWTPRRHTEYGVFSIDRLEMKLLKPAGYREIAPKVREILDGAIQKRVGRL